jgi:hypothetical protein
MALTSVTVTLDRQAIRRKVQIALQKTGVAYLDAGNKLIQSPQWQYPIAPSPRDIVDTERLLNSGRTYTSRRGVEVVWEAPYAGYVHDGVTFKNGTSLPGRPWTMVALRQLKATEVFAAAYANA